MNKSTILLTLLGVATLWLGYTSATVLEDAIQWWYNQGLTRYTSSIDFRPYDTLRRDEAAKFFVEFANLEHPTMPLNYNLNCTFSDSNQAQSDLKSYLSTACQRGILKGYERNSQRYIMPDQKLTNAQAITVVIRIIDGVQSEVGVAHRADNYYKRAMELGISISGFWDKNAIVTRGNVISLLYSAVNVNKTTTIVNSNGSVESVLQQIVDILGE